MNHILFSEIFQGLENLNGKTADETKVDSLEIIVLYELIEIN
jgi:hypothetical protein